MGHFVDIWERLRYSLIVPERERKEMAKMSVDLRRVKAERVAKGYSQEYMAKMLGWKSRATYSKRETGKVSLGADELAKIASVLGFSNDELGIFFTITVPKRERN